jgi:hypothetical protein
MMLRQGGGVAAIPPDVNGAFAYNTPSISKAALMPVDLTDPTFGWSFGDRFKNCMGSGSRMYWDEFPLIQTLVGSARFLWRAEDTILHLVNK